MQVLEWRTLARRDHEAARLLAAPLHERRHHHLRCVLARLDQSLRWARRLRPSEPWHGSAQAASPQQLAAWQQLAEAHASKQQDALVSERKK
eukprot:5904346-Lingulodinium_polyedra.AAC.1